MLSLRRAASTLVWVGSLLLRLALGTAQSQVIDSYTGALSDASPTFRRPDSAGTSVQSDTTYKYQQHTVTITTSGSYSLRSYTSFDGFTALYSGSFSAASPLTNLAAVNDDFGGFTSRSGFDLSLSAGTYIFVTTSFNTEVTGNFTNKVFVIGTPTPRFSRTNSGTPPTSVATDYVGGDVYYEVVDISSQVTVSGLYKISVTAADPLSFETFLLLYHGAFMPNSSLTNAIAANDDGGRAGSPDSAVSVNLTVGQTYKAVVTGYRSDDFGPYTLTVTKIPDPPLTVFRRPNSGFPPTTVAAETAYPHYVETWTPATTGFYKVKTIAATPATFNTFTVLYDTSFDKNNPLANVLIANDTLSNEGGASGFYVSVVAGHTYKIVTTGSSTMDFGAYTTELTLIGQLRNSFNDTTVGAPPFVGGRPLASSPANTPPSGRSDQTPPYKAYIVTVGTGGNYTFHMSHPAPVMPTFDTFLVLYRGELDLSDAVSNCLAANDDFDTMTDFNRSAIVSIPLMAGTAYTIVTTGFYTTAQGSFTLEAFGPGTVRIARPVKISGQITTLVPNKTLQISFRIRPVGGTSADDTVKAITITTDSQGKASYELKNIPSGSVNFIASGERTLQTLVSNVDAGNDVSNINFTLKSGDANSDNFVDIRDLLILIAHYNQINGSPGNDYSPLVDFNFDNGDDIGDLLILISNYNQSGQYLP